MYLVEKDTCPEEPESRTDPTALPPTRHPDPRRPPSAPRRWDSCPAERTARWTDAPRRAPEVTQEWPADRPAPKPPAFPWPLALMAGLLALVALGLVPGRFLGTPAGIAVAGSLSALCLAAYLRAVSSETPNHRIVSRALSDLQLDRDPRSIIMHLQEAGLRGRSGLRRDIAVRCLDGARRHRRLEERLMREAERWLQRTKDELVKE